jgi:hypothetical protein
LPECAARVPGLNCRIRATAPTLPLYRGADNDIGATSMSLQQLQQHRCHIGVVSCATRETTG